MGMGMWTRVRSGERGTSTEIAITRKEQRGERHLERKVATEGRVAPQHDGEGHALLGRSGLQIAADLSNERFCVRPAQRPRVGHHEEPGSATPLERAEGLRQEFHSPFEEHRHVMHRLRPCRVVVKHHCGRKGGSAGVRSHLPSSPHRGSSPPDRSHPGSAAWQDACTARPPPLSAASREEDSPAPASIGRKGLAWLLAWSGREALRWASLLA